ncbi:winged helix-turn-helix domain-containing protein [Denitrobaculum tricleocarpae]|uniref:OmpR/PhoB-type domain-containing protein n=1 Tax=Denitrobaculum tricleocarpae TaxID=2591009 RepID=A0A545TTM2_9PROT|nr:transcriptional regulator [Denitrobaculum tricleocarpae]TQV80576.1 hypothetical protein FKG95_10410 [Denitrobaculum tricleocarpae]
MGFAKFPLAGESFTLSDRSFHVGTWRVDLSSRSVTDGNAVKRVSPRAARLLEVLAASEGQAVAREALLDVVWPDVIVGDDSLTQAVTELRRAFDDRRGSSRMIETIPKYGYRLTAPILLETAANDAAPLSEASDCFDLEAYGLCLDARRAIARSGRGGFMEPEALAKAAVETAPNFALGHAEYTITLCYRWLYQRGEDDGLIKALEHAETALRLRPDLGICYAAMAFAQGAYGNADRARAALAQGLARDPGDSEIHYLGARTLLAMRDYRGAVSFAERAAELNPDDLRPLYLAARAAMVFDPVRGQRSAYACLARVQARIIADPTEARARNTLGPLHALLGDRENCWRALNAQDGYRSPLQFYDVVALAQVGEFEAASQAFERVVDLGWRHKEWLVAEPTLALLKDNKTFRRAARAVGVA